MSTEPRNHGTLAQSFPVDGEPLTEELSGDYDFKIYKIAHNLKILKIRQRT